MADPTARELYAEAARRLHFDPLLSARVKLAARIINAADATGEATHPDHSAAVALVVAERPELITGELPAGAPPLEVIAGRISAIADPARPVSSIRDAAAGVLAALALEGYEVGRRADRFATLERDVHEVRIPVRGQCGICRQEVWRSSTVRGPELMVGPWTHVVPDGDRDDDGHAAGAVIPA